MTRLLPWRAAPLASDFDGVYDAQFARLVAALRLAGADQQTAEDVAQEAFVRVLVRWRSISDPAAYVFRTAFRLYGRGRARAARGRHLIEQSVLTAVATTEETVLRRHAVEEVLDRLSRRQRECAVLAFYIGCSTEEVAAHLGIRPATVRVHLHDARAVLSTTDDPLGWESIERY